MPVRVGEGRESEVMLAMTNPVFFPATSVARRALFDAGGEFQPSIVKTRFQLSRFPPILVNRRKTFTLRLPFKGCAATSAPEKITSNRSPSRDRDGPSVRLFHARPVKDLPGQPQGPR